MEHACACGQAEEFGAGVWAKIDEVIAKYRDKPGSLIPVLEEVQGITGYLPEKIQRHVANGLSIPLSQVYGVVTFYSFFTMKPRGKHQIRVCLGTACHVRGSQAIVDKLDSEMRLQPGECTPDREFSLEVVRCLGACGLAPVMMVDDDTISKVKVTKLDQILDKYREDV